MVLISQLPVQAISYSISSEVPYRKNLNNSIRSLNPRIGYKAFTYKKDGAEINIIWDTVNTSIFGYIEPGEPCIIHITPSTLVFNGKQIDKDFISVMGLHELGHCIGLEHNDNPDSIMYAHPLPNTKILKSDIEDIKQVLNSAL